MPIRNSRKYRSKLPMFSGRPDLTPLIDVLFLSLIFFMVSSSFIKLYGVKVELPRTKSAKYSSVEKFVIAIAYTEGRSIIYFNDEELPIEKLAEKLAKIRSEVRTATVIICPDRSTPVEVVVRVMAIAERAKLSSFLAVEDDNEINETVFETE